jgi:hypothetical protein
MGKYSDNTKDSGDSSSQAAHAEHDARDHATKEGVFERGNNEKNSTPFSRTDSAGSASGGFWDSIFGKK